MLFADLRASLKTKIAPAYVLSGSDIFLINKSIELILAAAQIPPLALVHLPLDAPLNDVNAHLSNTSMFAASPAAIDRGTADTRLYLRPIKSINEAEKVDCNPMSEDLVMRLVLQNKRFTPPAALLLARASENNFAMVSAEIQKAESFFDPVAHPQITDADLSTLVTKTEKYQVFELTDAILKRDLPRVRRILDFLLPNDEGDAYGVFGLLNTFARRLFYAKSSRLTDADLGKHLGVHPYAITVIRRDKSITEKAAAAAYEAAIDLEYQIKSGQILAPRAVPLLIGALL